jgi:biotin carboxyl carrier protein
MKDEKYFEENYTTFIINVAKYKTKLTHKHLGRKSYVPKDLNIIKAFIPGTVISVCVKPGQKVKEGDILLVFDAMKMYNNLISPFNAIVKTVNVKPGDRIEKSTVLIELA